MHESCPKCKNENVKKQDVWKQIMILLIHVHFYSSKNWLQDQLQLIPWITCMCEKSAYKEKMWGLGLKSELWFIVLDFFYYYIQILKDT